VEDQATGMVTLDIEDDFGEARDRSHGLAAGSHLVERWSILPDDPLSARAEVRWTQTHARADWSTRTEVETGMTSGPDSFRITAEVRAFEGGREVFVRAYDETVPRSLV
jgi:hypothetical protein